MTPVASSVLSACSESLGARGCAANAFSIEPRDTLPVDPTALGPFHDALTSGLLVGASPAGSVPSAILDHVGPGH